MWESRVSGSERGRRFNCDMVEILWHRRESRRQTEKTNFDLQSREAPAYSKTQELKNSRTQKDSFPCVLEY